MGWFSKKEVIAPSLNVDFETFDTDAGKLSVIKTVGVATKTTCVSLYSNKVGYIDLGLKKVGDAIYMTVQSMQKDLKMLQGDKVYLAFDDGKALGNAFEGSPQRTGGSSSKGAIIIENSIHLDEDFDQSILQKNITGIQYHSEKIPAPVNFPLSSPQKSLTPQVMQLTFKNAYIKLKNL